MKKVIAAAAGLMLVGTMVSSASAAVTFSGDARVRAYYQTDYDFGRETDGVRENEKEQSWSSRVRVVVRAESKGGAYARARIRMADTTWDGTNNRGQQLPRGIYFYRLSTTRHHAARKMILLE